MSNEPKLLPHPPTGALASEQRYPEVSGNTIRALHDLVLEVERKMTNGPWDQWDGVVLEEWRRVATRQFQAACRRLDEAEAERQREDIL